MKRKILLVPVGVLLYFWVAPLDAYAQRVGWIPGDSVFISSPEISVQSSESRCCLVLTSASYPKLEDAGIHSFGGFQCLQLVGPDDVMKRIAMSVENAIERTAATNGSEEVRILVYDIAFDHLQYHLGLRYNEKWMNRVYYNGPSQRKREGTPFQKYENPLLSRESVIYDWAYAAKVPPLHVEIPSEYGDWGYAGEPILDPVNAEHSTKKLFIASLSQLESMLQGTEDSECYYVNAVGVLGKRVVSDGRISETGVFGDD